MEKFQNLLEKNWTSFISMMCRNIFVMFIPEKIKLTFMESKSKM